MKKKVMLFIILMLSIGNIAYANEDMVLTRSIIERNNGIVNWDNSQKKITINYLEKELSIWVDKADILINNQLETMDYKPILRNGKTILPKEFFNEYLGIKETFKDELNYQVNFRVETERELSWETGTFINDYSYKKSLVTPREIIEKIQEIVFYFEDNANIKFDLSDLKVIIYEGLYREQNFDDGALGIYTKRFNRMELFSLHDENIINTVIHETGHYFEDKFLSESDFEEYIKFRGLDLDVFNSRDWLRKPTEVFAEDFVNIFNFEHYNKTLAYNLNPEELEEFKYFLFRKMDK